VAVSNKIVQLVSVAPSHSVKKADPRQKALAINALQKANLVILLNSLSNFEYKAVNIGQNVCHYAQGLVFWWR